MENLETRTKNSFLRKAKNLITVAALALGLGSSVQGCVYAAAAGAGAYAGTRLAQNNRAGQWIELGYGTAWFFVNGDPVYCDTNCLLFNGEDEYLLRDVQDCEKLNSDNKQWEPWYPSPPITFPEAHKSQFTKIYGKCK